MRNVAVCGHSKLLIVVANLSILKLVRNEVQFPTESQCTSYLVTKLNCITLFVYIHKHISCHALADTILVPFSKVSNIWPIVIQEC